MGEHEKPEPETEVQEVKEVNKLGIPWKAIFSFLGVFAAQLWARATVTGIPVIPETTSGWLALIGGSLVTAVGVYLKGNVYTVPQAQNNLDKAIDRQNK